MLLFMLLGGMKPIILNTENLANVFIMIREINEHAYVFLRCTEDEFNPKAAQQKCLSHTLIELLNQVSKLQRLTLFHKS